MEAETSIFNSSVHIDNSEYFQVPPSETEVFCINKLKKIKFNRQKNTKNIKNICKAKLLYRCFLACGKLSFSLKKLGKPCQKL
ncbi:MAG: hypothetical protein IJ262_03490 [Clostridia bacterium]|nr:hypothetical protein [Clostridia bacterium]